jgi:hypothetical protein
MHRIKVATQIIPLRGVPDFILLGNGEMNMKNNGIA